MPPYSPTIAIGASGTVFACGVDGGLACASRSTDGTWDVSSIPPGVGIERVSAAPVGAYGAFHALFSAQETGVYMQIGHVWTPEGGAWDTEWVTDQYDSAIHIQDGLSLAIDGEGALHGTFADGINFAVPTFDRWTTMLRYVRKGPQDSTWTDEVLVSEASDPSTMIGADGGVQVVFAPSLPFGAAHNLVLARRAQNGVWTEEPFSCGAIRAAMPQAVSAGAAYTLCSTRKELAHCHWFTSDTARSRYQR
jgi:hypothetical protein